MFTFGLDKPQPLNFCELKTIHCKKTKKSTLKKKSPNSETKKETALISILSLLPSLKSQKNNQGKVVPNFFSPNKEL